MKILALFDYFHPGYRSGGPAKSSKGFAENLSDILNINIITRDHDFGTSTTYFDVSVNKWIKQNNYSILYLSKKYFWKFFLLKLRNEKFDCYYFNSIFSLNFSIIPLILIRVRILPNNPIIIAPRGELASSALNKKKRKKTFYLKVFKIISKGLQIRYQATSEHELVDIKNILKTDNIMLANNLRPKSDIPEFNCSQKKTNTLRVCCVSRISRVKNIEFAIRTINEVKGEIIFHIYGSEEDQEYYNFLKSISNNSKIEFKGSIKPDEVIPIIKNYDLFYLPTEGENFGHSILESFIASRPVLISNMTPWKNLSESNAGFEISLSEPEDFKKKLVYFLEMGKEKHNILCKGAYQKSIEYFNSIKLTDYYKLFSFN